MSRCKKGWLIAAASLILLGGLLFVGVMGLLQWNFAKLSTTDYDFAEYGIEEAFKEIAIKTDTAHIELIPAAGEQCRVECLEEEKMRHRVYVADNTLKIEIEDLRAWYDYISIFNFKKSKISVYLPQKTYDALLIETDTGDIKIPEDFSFGSLKIEGSTADVETLAAVADRLKIELSTGDIKAANLSAKAMEISTHTGTIEMQAVASNGHLSIKSDTGKIRLAEVGCKALSVESGSGDLFLKKLIAAEQITIESNTGDVCLEECDGGALDIKTSTGDVFGSLLSEKIFLASSSTGDIDLPPSASGGRCEVETSTGDIRFEIK